MYIVVDRYVLNFIVAMRQSINLIIENIPFIVERTETKLLTAMLKF